MSMINKEINDFSAQAYVNETFTTVTKNDILGKWSVFFFYPADFTFVCPTKLEDLARNHQSLCIYCLFVHLLNSWFVLPYLILHLLKIPNISFFHSSLFPQYTHSLTKFIYLSLLNQKPSQPKLSIVQPTRKQLFLAEMKLYAFSGFDTFPSPVHS